MAAVTNKNQNKNANRKNRQRNRPGKTSEVDAVSEAVSPTNEVNGSQKDASSTPVETGKVTKEENEEEAKVCLICAEPVKYYSVSECNHRTCHVCALRLRVLYKKLDCTLCKHPQEHVIFTVSPDKPYTEYDVENMPFKDAKQSILFETQEMMEETMILLRFNCPDNDCAFIGRNWNDLKAHVRAVHGKLMCDLCIRHKKVFAHEHALYTHAQLLIHLPSMGHRPLKQTQNEKVEGGIHPLCEFCRECMFSDDELFAHMRDRHEECFVCKRQGVRDQYFQDYNSLEQHFTQAHFPCTQSSCREQKFVVFGSSIDLQAHMVEVHGSAMSTRDKKDARRVVADFEFEEARTGNRRRDRDRTAARGREQEQEPPPVAQIQGRGGLNRRREGFGAALTSDEPSGSGSNTPAVRPSRHPSPSPTREPVDPATAQRHAAFMSRLASLTNNSSSATASVRSAIRSYRGSESAARDLILTIYNVLDSDLDATGGLISLLVDLLDEEKRKSLLESWNGFKIEHRAEFPELTPATADNVYAGVASGRVLTAKSSTARSSQQSRRQVWDRVARAAGNSNIVIPQPAGPSSTGERFPALPAQRNASTATAPTPSYRKAPRMTPWASSSSAAPPPRSEAQGSTNRKNNAASLLSDSSFPSLPTANARTLPPMSGNQSLRNIIGGTGPSVNAWTPSSEPTTTSDNVEDNSAETPGPKGKKKKGKEKVTLFTLGTFPA